MPIIFVLGILAIAFEDKIKINKAATSIGMCILLWLMFLIDSTGIFTAHRPPNMDNFLIGFPEFAKLTTSELALRYVEFSIVEALGDVSTTLFFVLASMAIIEIADTYGAFGVITSSIKSRSKRKLLWIFSIITFGLSALLGDLATVIVMIAVMRKIIPDAEQRLVYSCMTIIAANAGGAWSPIGDVTTLLLWTGGNISVLHQVSHLILPSITMMLVPLLIITFTFPKDSSIEKVDIQKVEYPEFITPKFQKTILYISLASLALVPVFQSIFNLPPFMGVLLGLVILWAITDIKNARYKKNSSEYKVSNLFGKLDISTVLFFLGILMSVQALKSVGFLTTMSDSINSVISNSNTIALLLGVCSSFLDNVALVAASMGMYPIAEAGAFMADGTFWTFLAYCAVTGGSILIIGSASGVTVMGIEKISFMYYFKKFTILALLGYAAGAGVYLLLI